LSYTRSFDRIRLMRVLRLCTVCSETSVRVKRVDFNTHCRCHSDSSSSRTKIASDSPVLFYTAFGLVVETQHRDVIAINNVCVQLSVQTPRAVLIDNSKTNERTNKNKRTVLSTAEWRIVRGTRCAVRRASVSYWRCYIAVLSDDGAQSLALANLGTYFVHVQRIRRTIWCLRKMHFGFET